PLRDALPILCVGLLATDLEPRRRRAWLVRGWAIELPRMEHRVDSEVERDPWRPRDRGQPTLIQRLERTRVAEVAESRAAVVRVLLELPRLTRGEVSDDIPSGWRGLLAEEAECVPWLGWVVVSLDS